MGSYKIEFKKSAEKDLAKLPREILPRIIKAIRNLEQDPFPHGVKKLRNYEKSYRIRISNYRILYTVYKKVLIIEIIQIGHRKEIYRR